MGEQLVKHETAGQLADAARIGERLAGYIAQGKAANTRRAYAADFAHFAAWCESYGASALPAAPEVVALYLAALAETHKPATLTRRLSAISTAHAAAGLESPTRSALVREALRGIRHARGTAPGAKLPVTVADLRAIVAALPAGPKGARDKALLLVGFAGAFRRSELAAIERQHVAFVPEGVVITLARSKTDQAGAGRPVAIPYGAHAETCPVRALRAWLEAAGIESGPVFRAVDRWGNVGAAALTDRAVALVVQGYMGQLGRDPRAYGGHSLRAGFATAAAAAGAEERDIMRQTGHTSRAMVRRYIRDGSLWRANAAASLGL